LSNKLDILIAEYEIDIEQLTHKLEISDKYKKEYEKECIDLRKEQEDFLALQKKQLT